MGTRGKRSEAQEPADTRPPVEVSICPKCLTPLTNGSRGSKHCPLCDKDDPLYEKGQKEEAPFVPFALLMHSCHLTQRQTVNYLKSQKLDVSIDAVSNWATGRRNAPEEVYKKMIELVGEIEQCARYGRKPTGIMRLAIARRSLEMRILARRAGADGDF